MASQNHPLPQPPPPVPQHYSQYNGPYQQQQPAAYQQYAQQPSPGYGYPAQQPQQQQFPQQAYNYPAQQPYQQQYQQPYQQPYQQGQLQYQPRPDPNQQPPPPPQHRQQQGARPPGPESRKSRTFSFRSDKSSQKGHDALVETSAEKEAKRLHSKADPTLAMNEAEPGVVAATVKASLASIRSVKHKDANGNTIEDPDWSNPTRSRWERPLDTIRGFEAAIDGDRGDRRSTVFRETDSVANWNKRSSVYTTSGNPNGGRPGYPRDSYYGGRPPSMMHGPQQYDRYNRYGGQDDYPDQQWGQGYNAYSAPPRQRYSRMASEPQFYTPRQAEQHVYPMPQNGRSYETVASGSGSGSGASGEQAGYQTDPTSSENSSIDRVQAPPKPPANDYGIGFSQNQSANYTLGFNGSQAAANAAAAPAQNGYPNTGQPSQVPMPNQTPNAAAATPREMPPPAVPRKESTILRKPTRTPSAPPVSMATGALAPPPERPALGEKRKSWLARRFSRKA